MMWYWGTGMHWWGWGLGAFTTLIFWGLIIWAIVALVRWTRGTGSGPWHDGTHGGTWRHDDDPEEILARRFAAGEIDADDYRERLNALRARHDRQYTATENRH